MKKVINSLSEIPEGMTEAQEREYWEEHEMGDGIKFYPVPKDDPDLPPARERTIPDEVRRLFDDDTREGLLALAEKRGMSVRRLLKLMVLEQLQVEEERETVQ
jgi:hypothetical protein